MLKHSLASSLLVFSAFCSFAAHANESKDSVWECQSRAIVNDAGFKLTYFPSSNLALIKANSYFGEQDFAKLTLCSSSQAEGSDMPTIVTCHDGLWKDSVKTVLALGGYIPFIGSAEIFTDGPENYSKIDDLSCNLILAD